MVVRLWVGTAHRFTRFLLRKKTTSSTSTRKRIRACGGADPFARCAGASSLLEPGSGALSSHLPGAGDRDDRKRWRWLQSPEWFISEVSSRPIQLPCGKIRLDLSPDAGDDRPLSTTGVVLQV